MTDRYNNLVDGVRQEWVRRRRQVMELQDDSNVQRVQRLLRKVGRLRQNYKIT